MAGLGVTLLAVGVFSWYALRQIDGLRDLQTDTVDRNRRDSLQLIRIQNNLNSLGLSMRDMLEGSEPYPLTAYKGEFDRIRFDLDDALRLEAELTPATRTPEQQRNLTASVERFWSSVDAMFALARDRREDDARALIRSTLLGQQAALTSTVARLLVANNEAEERAAEQIQRIYSGVERNIYYFLTAMLAAIAAVSLYLISANRRLFDRLAALSEQRSTLARKLITVQEDLFRSLSRELHDEFGQILTAVGAMLRRAEIKGLPENSPLKSELREITGAVQQTLEKVRSLSQTLHPNVLDDFGLEGTLEWYTRQFERQTGLVVRYEKQGSGPIIRDETAIHVYRIAQEALNNAARHAKAGRATVRLRLAPDRLRLEVEDDGIGMPAAENNGARPGLGLVAMRERAELLNGTLEVGAATAGGTRVALEIPLDKVKAS